MKSRFMQMTRGPAPLALAAMAASFAAVLLLCKPSLAQAAALTPELGRTCTFMADWQTAKDSQRTAERVLVVELKPLPSQRPGAWVRAAKTNLDHHVAVADLFDCQ